MNKSSLLLSLIMLPAVWAFHSDNIRELSIGSSIPKADLKMLEVSGERQLSLKDIKGQNGLLVIFSCNTCPFVKANEVMIGEMASYASSNMMGVVLVNSNEALRGAEDSQAAMKSYIDQSNFSFVKYVIDKKSELADAFGATRTPECFLFDKNGKLVYKGAITDNGRMPESATQFYLKDAIGELVDGKAVEVSSTKSIGCSIKREATVNKQQ